MGRQAYHGVTIMEMLKQSLARSIHENEAILKERERQAAEDRVREREPGIEPEFMNRAARRRAAKLARKMARA